MEFYHSSGGVLEWCTLLFVIQYNKKIHLIINIIFLVQNRSSSGTALLSQGDVITPLTQKTLSSVSQSSYTPYIFPQCIRTQSIEPRYFSFLW